MNKCKIAIHALLLATTPTFLAYPENTSPQIRARIELVSSRKLHKNFRKKKRYHLLTYDQILKLIDEVESGKAEKKYRNKDIKRINRFLGYLAAEGMQANPENALALEAHINDLLCDDEYEFAFDLGNEDEYLIIPAIAHGDAQPLLCKNWFSKKWKKTKKFVKKHRKEILIGAAVVVAVAAIVVVVAATPAAAAGVAAGAAGAASAGKSDKEEAEEPNPQKPLFEALHEAPVLEGTINEHVASFKEFTAEDVIIQSIDAQDPSWADTTRELGSLLAHETLEGISEMTSILPGLEEDIKEFGSKIFPGQAPSDNPFMKSPQETYDRLVEMGHEMIDRTFATNQSIQYTEEAKANDPLNDFTTGYIPPPGSFSKGLSTSKFREVIEAGKETAVLAEELGFSAKEIAQLEQAGALEKTVTRAYKELVNNPAMFESKQRFKQATDFLKEYKGKYMPEIRVRELIHEAGVKTFPRPKGIPDNYRVKLSNKGAGIKYVHPIDEGTYVRVMPGQPYSQKPGQQRPYVNHRIHGKSIDKFGNFVSNKSKKAHIPVEEFIYRDKI